MFHYDHKNNGRFSITLQPGDGNLVMYHKNTLRAIWATYAFGGTVAVVQGDSNFVVYNESIGPLFPIWDAQRGTPYQGNVMLSISISVR